MVTVLVVHQKFRVPQTVWAERKNDFLVLERPGPISHLASPHSPTIGPWQNDNPLGKSSMLVALGVINNPCFIATIVDLVKNHGEISTNNDPTTNQTTTSSSSSSRQPNSPALGTTQPRAFPVLRAHVEELCGQTRQHRSQPETRLHQQPERTHWARGPATLTRSPKGNHGGKPSETH